MYISDGHMLKRVAYGLLLAFGMGFKLESGPLFFSMTSQCDIRPVRLSSGCSPNSEFLTVVMDNCPTWIWASSGEAGHLLNLAVFKALGEANEIVINKNL
ncbi:hypothetical protein LINGRAHAP2_LOCUS19729 [Linum grandiflorum]